MLKITKAASGSSLDADDLLPDFRTPRRLHPKA